MNNFSSSQSRLSAALTVSRQDISMSVRDVFLTKGEYRIDFNNNRLFCRRKEILFGGLLQVYSFIERYFIYIPNAECGFFCESYEILTKRKKLTGAGNRNCGSLLRIELEKDDYFYLNLIIRSREDIKFQYELTKWSFEDILGLSNFIKACYEVHERAILELRGEKNRGYDDDSCLLLAKRCIQHPFESHYLLDKNHQVREINFVEAYFQRTTVATA